MLTTTGQTINVVVVNGQAVVATAETLTSLGVTAEAAAALGSNLNMMEANKPGGGGGDPKEFKVGIHGEMPSPRGGSESHHGVMSRWMEEKFASYDPDKAPSMLMDGESHNATRGVYNTWRAEMRQKMGGTFDWAKVSEADIRALSERMFDAAGVPADIRAQYYARFQQFLGTLTPK